MSDKATLSHIERMWYVAPDTSPGDSVHYGELHEKSLMWYYERYDQFGPVFDSGHYVHGIPCTIIEATECGDYSGNALVGESNYRTMKAEFPWLVEIYGSHGYKALAYLGKRENQSDALIEAIDSLADYPLYDESDHSELECERESEAWSEDGEHDFKRALAKYFDEVDEDHEHDEDKITDELIAAAALPRRWYAEPMSSVWDLWREGCEGFNVNGGSGYTNEQGDAIHFYIDAWIDSARKPNYPGWSDDFRRAHDMMREHLATLATMCRTSDDNEQGA